MLLLGGISAWRYDGEYLEAIHQQSSQFCRTSASNHGCTGINLAVSAQEYGSLLLQQPACWEPELYQGITPQAADSAVHTGGMGADTVYPEEGGAMIKICFIINNINQYGGIEQVYAQLATIFSKHL